MSSVGIEMIMNPASLEADSSQESAVVRADAPRQGKPMLRGEPQEQARLGYAARALKKELTRRPMQGVKSVYRGREAAG
jgi:hypothetical protein